MLNKKYLCKFTATGDGPTIDEVDEYRRNLAYFEYEYSVPRLFYLLYDRPLISIAAGTFKVVLTRGEVWLKKGENRGNETKRIRRDYWKTW